MRRLLLLVTACSASLLVLSSTAQAIVVDTTALGQTSVPFSASSVTNYAGVALMPGDCNELQNSGTCGLLANAGIPTVTSSAPCSDPALTPDLRLPDTGICSHGGEVMNGSENFALTWDPQRRYFSVTRGYVEQFLRDVANGSGTLTSPYAVTSQYTGPHSRALNNARFGGGCIDYGATGGSACEFGSPTGSGHDYPANGCQPAGDSLTALNIVNTNTVCLTDAQLQGEVTTIVTQTGMLGRTQPGDTPLVTLLLPPDVEACLDATSRLCSSNGGLTPPVKQPTTTSTGGTLAAGTYQVKTTYVTASGESAPSAAVGVDVTAAPSSGGSGSGGTTGPTGPTGPAGPTSTATGTITIPTPAAANGATGWYAYVEGPGGNTFVRQAGPTAIGSSLTLTSIASDGPQPPDPLFFCSYHSQVSVGGTEVPYLVQPWTAGTGCDEPGMPAPPDPNIDPVGFSENIGTRLVNPLSQAQIASIVNPGLNGWFALNGAEINDNGFNGYGCQPLGIQYDTVPVGSGSYVLQREFNNAGVMESDPTTYFGCAPNVLFTPAFVMPTSVIQGKEVQLDGSATTATLMVPNSGYTWSFGDGSSATGASVVHTFAKAGTYTVTLHVIDLGFNVGSVSQTIQVLEPNGQPAPPPTPPAPPASRVQLRVQLLPQSLGQVLHQGISAILASNTSGAGFASVLISRAAAKRARITVGRSSTVVVGQGTLAAIKDGQMSLRLRLSRAMATKLERLDHVTLTVHLTLVSDDGQRVAITVAGNY